jgi:ABC-2 type transport system permease protein
MRTGYILQAFRLIFIEILRNRIIVLLFFLIPVIFYLIAWLTLSSDPIMFILGSITEKPVITVIQQDLGIVFIGLAANGLIASFLALYIMQKDTYAKKRLILCGYRPTEIIISSMLVVISSMLIIGLFVSFLGLILFDPKHIPGVFAGFFLCAWIYGGYGLLIGTIVKRELEGILFIVLLANLDIGWLQNPIYYATAQSKTIIEWLPAFYPSQVTITSAFSDFPAGKPVILSVVYGSVFVLMALLIFYLKIRISKHG